MYVLGQGYTGKDSCASRTSNHVSVETIFLWISFPVFNILSLSLVFSTVGSTLMNTTSAIEIAVGSYTYQGMAMKWCVMHYRFPASFLFWFNQHCLYCVRLQLFIWFSSSVWREYRSSVLWVTLILCCEQVKQSIKPINGNMNVRLKDHMDSGFLSVCFST